MGITNAIHCAHLECKQSFVRSFDTCNDQSSNFPFPFHFLSQMLWYTSALVLLLPLFPSLLFLWIFLFSWLSRIFDSFSSCVCENIFYCNTTAAAAAGGGGCGEGVVLLLYSSIRCEFICHSFRKNCQHRLKRSKNASF